MLLPVGDAPNPRGVPVVTLLLIAVNVAVFVLVTLPLGAERPSPSDPAFAEYLRVMSQALHGRVPTAVLARQTTVYDLFVFHHGFRPAAPSLEAIFVSMFLHAGFMHLAGNMLFLWIYGDNVEYRLGRVRYLLAYLGTGAAATVFHWMGASGSPVPVVGASGAISGVLGFYFVWFPRNVVRLLWLLPPLLGHVVVVRARLVLALYLLVDNLLPYLFAGDDLGVAHGAHIGGFLAGLALAWLADRRAAGQRPAEYREYGADPPGPGDAIGALVDAGHLADAAQAYFARPARGAEHVLSPRQALALAGWLQQQGHLEAALVTLRRAARTRSRGPDVAAVHLALGSLLLDAGQPPAAYQHFLAVLDLDADDATVAAARSALARITARR